MRLYISYGFVMCNKTAVQHFFVLQLRRNYGTLAVQHKFSASYSAMLYSLSCEPSRPGDGIQLFYCSFIAALLYSYEPNALRHALCLKRKL